MPLQQTNLFAALKRLLSLRLTGHRLLRIRHWQIVVLITLLSTALTAHAQTVRMLLQHAPLAGVQYYEAEQVWAELREGDLVELARDPENQHDGQAIRVLWRGHLLGFLPRRENKVAAQALDQGYRLEARLLRLTRHPDPWQRIHISIWASVKMENPAK